MSGDDMGGVIVSLAFVGMFVFFVMQSIGG